MGIIYKITSPTGRLYIGQTVHLVRRINLYKYCIANPSRWKNAKIMNSLKKYGWEAHKFEIIEECPDEKLNEREIFWINELGTFFHDNPFHMNMSEGGSSGRRPWMFDIERRETQSKRFTGTGNPFYGKTHTAEFKKKKSLEVAAYNKKMGVKIPKWGVEKGRAAVEKEVIVYNNKGECIGEYQSITKAAIYLGIKAQAASDSVCYNQWANGKFLVQYKSDGYVPTIEVGGINMKSVKRPVMTLNEDFEVVCEHPSAQEASEFWNIPKTTINRAAMYNWLKPIRTGHIFIYSDLYEIIFQEVTA